MIYYCEKCLEKGVCRQSTGGRHHKFSKTYGKTGTAKIYKDVIDHPDNIIYLCYDCHMWKSLEKWTEKEFCEKMGIEPRTKSGKWIEKRGKKSNKFD